MRPFTGFWLSRSCAGEIRFPENRKDRAEGCYGGMNFPALVNLDLGLGRCPQDDLHFA